MDRCRRDFSGAILPPIRDRQMDVFQEAINFSMKSCYEDALKAGGNRDAITGYYLNDAKPYSDRSEITACIRERHTPEADANKTAADCCNYCNRMYNF